jgi:hypothetical protein
MRGDFTRDSFDPTKGFTRVLMQQGRVQLDADWNEQSSIIWHYLRELTRDLLGPYGGPESNLGFIVIPASDVNNRAVNTEEQNRLRGLLKDPGDFLIGPGNYYVDGIRVVNADYVRYSRQSHMQRAQPLRSANASYLVYLDVWEQELSALQDASIREVALNGADTANRTRLVWQVRVSEVKANGADIPDWDTVISEWNSSIEKQSSHRGLLRVKTANAGEGDDQLEPTTIAPSSTYRGPQNQLYRVEVHNSGTAKDGATFKWSRENGSVMFAIESFADPVLTLRNLGRDARSGLTPGDWVEVCDDDSVFEHTVHPLRQVETVDTLHNQVTLKGKGSSAVGSKPERHPILIRWDHKQGDPRKGGLELKNGAALIREGANSWLKLENGIQVQFEAGHEAQNYRAGDYWMIPARTATGSVEWPRHGNEPRALRPHGIEHHYAPLSGLSFYGAALTVARSFQLSFSIPTSHDVGGKV